MVRRRRSQRPPPVGVVLAGGEGRRIGGDKAVVELGGRPLLYYPLAAVHAALDDVAVVCKRATALPELDARVAIWLEDDEPHHPLTGVVHALRRAGGRSVMVVAGDMPFMTQALVVALVREAAGAAPAVVPRAGGRLHVLCARYDPPALAALAGFDPRASARDTVAALGPQVVDWPDDDPFFAVTRPEDLLRAAALLDSR
jgi:molybdopterin-guanine dinucleotide biosynthesis protein A